MQPADKRFTVIARVGEKYGPHGQNPLAPRQNPLKFQVRSNESAGRTLATVADNNRHNFLQVKGTGIPLQ